MLRESGQSGKACSMGERTIRGNSRSDKIDDPEKQPVRPGGGSKTENSREKKEGMAAYGKRIIYSIYRNAE